MLSASISSFGPARVAAQNTQRLANEAGESRQSQKAVGPIDSDGDSDGDGMQSQASPGISKANMQSVVLSMLGQSNSAQSGTGPSAGRSNAAAQYAQSRSATTAA